MLLRIDLAPRENRIGETRPRFRLRGWLRFVRPRPRQPSRSRSTLSNRPQFLLFSPRSGDRGLLAAVPKVCHLRLRTGSVIDATNFSSRDHVETSLVLLRGIESTSILTYYTDKLFFKGRNKKTNFGRFMRAEARLKWMRKRKEENGKELK